MRVYLLGFMGSGKSTLGRKLAAHLGFGFIDLDKQIEERNGMTVPQYFERFGENAFRKAEQEALKHTAALEDTVIAVGGGTPCYFDNMDWMNAHGTTVYISMEPAALADRLANSKTERPLIRGLQGEALVSFIEKKLDEREPFYRKAAHTAEGLNLTPVKLAAFLPQN